MSGICIYAEQLGGVVEPEAARVVSGVCALAERSGRTVTMLTFGEDSAALARQLSFAGVRVAVVRTGLTVFEDDALSTVLADALRRLAPELVVIPSCRTARALFSRVAARLGCALTADCAELDLDENGDFIQRKSAYGANEVCVCAEKGKPKLVTVLTDVLRAPVKYAEIAPETIVLEGLRAESGVEVLGITKSGEPPLTEAEIVVSVGRGAVENGGIALAERLAQSLGGALGGTRPLVEEGQLPLERQIGVTGCTVRPKVCLYFGVSGALQHTEGVRGARLTIAVNSDPRAAIFDHADYGTTADAGEVMRALLALI